MRDETNIIVQVDKTVVKLTGIAVKGLNIQMLESDLKKKLQSMVRIIGVTGDSIEMDIYGMDETAIMRNENGVIQVIAAADGITVKDILHLNSVKKIKTVDKDALPAYISGGCQGERWAGK